MIDQPHLHGGPDDAAMAQDVATRKHPGHVQAGVVLVKAHVTPRPI